PLTDELGAISRRWNQLMTRHKQSMSLTDLPVLTVSQKQDIKMAELSSEVTIRSGDMDVEQLSDLDISPYYQHTARLQPHRDYASELPNDLISAKVYSGKHPAVYVLLQHEGLDFGLIYTPHNSKIRRPDTVKLLDILQCEPETETAAVDANEVEDLADECIRLWCTQNEADPQQVLRECAMYLRPKDESEGLDNLLVEKKEPEGQ
ncbi:MAG: hypothetical protein WBB01_07825, partial [Phormidesmis sp.]